MKNYLRLAIISLFAMIMLTTCDDSSSGGGGGTAAGTFTRIADLDSAGSYGGHFSTISSTTHIQHLYTASQINGSGYITAIAFRSNEATTAKIHASGVTVKMGHTGLSALTNTFADNAEQGKGSLVTVLENKAITVPVLAAGDYVTIRLATPFYYNGADNLVVDYIRDGTCDGSFYVSCDNGATANGSLWSNDLADTTGNLDYPLNMKFTFSGGDTVVYEGSGTGLYFPFYGSDTSDRKIQLMYGKGQINGSGPVSGIALQVGTATSAAASYTINVKMGHTSLTALGTTFDDNFDRNDEVMVAEGAAFTVPAGFPADSFIWLPLTGGRFTYNGTDNLVVEIEVLSATADLRLQWSTTSSNTRVLGDRGATTGAASNYQYGMKLRFYGGNMNIVYAGTSGFSYPFSSTNSKLQYQYHASDLGTMGTITKIGFRLLGNPVDSEYSDFKVVLGYATDASLGTIFSSNMTGARTVFSGTITIDSTRCKRGDWIEIPLSSPFYYDPTKDLVVQTSSLAGASTNSIHDYSDAVRYYRCEAYAADNTTDTAATREAYIGQISLDIR